MRWRALFGFLCAIGCGAHAGGASSGARRLVPPDWPDWNRTPGGARVGYPDEAWNAGLEGDAAVEVCLDERGEITGIRPAGGPAPLTSEVMRAIATWRYLPVGEGGGGPEPVCFPRRFRFRREPVAEEFFTTNAENIVTRGYQPPLRHYGPLPPPPGAGPMFVRMCPGKDGIPQDVTVIIGVGEPADSDVARTLMNWRYQPARLRGEVIAACEMVRIASKP